MVNATACPAVTATLNATTPLPINPAEQADYCFVTQVIDEARRARVKFPAPNTTFAAAVEEMGEVATAIMDLQRGTDTREHLVAECVQLAAMALRLAVEGDVTVPASLRVVDTDDDIGRFLAARTHAAPGAQVPAETMYRAYLRWCGDTGIAVPARRLRFGAAMALRGFAGGTR